jgi:hypothetical protein
VQARPFFRLFRERTNKVDGIAETKPRILDQYIKEAPSAQNALSIFKGEWSSQFPGETRLLAGSIPLFEDPRIAWAIDKLGSVAGQRVLELGPLEAGHTYLLEKAGAASITAIEANTRAYVKCLITKEVMSLQHAHFLCGDFMEYLRQDPPKFDICIASGVLYHMRNPAELLERLAGITDRLFLWTHYYDRDIINNDARLTSKFSTSVSAELGGFRHTLYRQNYQVALDWAGFCGGSEEYSHWLSRGDVLTCLEHFGFSQLEIGFDEPHHPNGPAFAVAARRG